MSDTIDTILRAAIQELEAGGIDGAAKDARLLVAHTLEIAPDRLVLVGDETFMPAGLTRLDAAIKARLERQPVSHILGRRNFWGRDFKVTPEVLDPRPETETLIEVALQKPFNKVLDLGTGSGCILLTLLAERPEATGLGTDLSPEALDVAVANRKSLDLDRAALFRQSDWLEGVVGQYDLIVSNPPYISMPEMAALAPEVLRWEPMAALTPGFTGLEAYEIIAGGVAEFLAPDGRILLEIGASQGADVSRLFQAAGFDIVALHADMDGRDRVVEARK
ncbi:MAG: peptide chain release factor N(5)-glutamine methyltransferase [Alphaproteobacteria bacterium]|nr:peptide chain release factor N(5)-glutamine methyltransferase [Alphaproteobacteria bacterium]